MNKTLCAMWCIAALVNLLVFLTSGFDYYDLLIAALEGLLAWDCYENYKRNGA